MQDPANKTLVQRLILESMNQAVTAAKELHVQAVRELTHGLDLPGLDKILEEMAR
jgi:DNA-binding protein YbaB